MSGGCAVHRNAETQRAGRRRGRGRRAHEAPNARSVVCVSRSGAESKRRPRPRRLPARVTQLNAASNPESIPLCARTVHWNARRINACCSTVFVNGASEFSAFSPCSSSASTWIA